MAKETVVLTGATDFIEASVLQLLLQRNYNVRVVVRNLTEQKTLLSNANLKGIENATFILVPDLLAPNALDAVVAGSQYIIHLASSIIDIDAEHDHDHETVVVPATQATLRVLEAAETSGTVKRVVIMSSAAAIVPPNEILANDDPPVNRFVAVSANDRVADIQPPYDSVSEAFCASKIAALNASDEFMHRQKRDFDVVNIMPSRYVLGRSLTAASTEDLLDTTNAVCLTLLTRKSDPDTPPEPAMAVHLDDAALAHVLALDKDKIPSTAGLGNYHIGQNIVWDDMVEIAVGNFFPAIMDGILSSTGTKKSKVGFADPAKVKQAFGFEMKALEEMVVDVTQQYLELLPQFT